MALYLELFGAGFGVVVCKWSHVDRLWVWISVRLKWRCRDVWAFDRYRYDE